MKFNLSEKKGRKEEIPRRKKESNKIARVHLRTTRGNKESSRTELLNLEVEGIFREHFFTSEKSIFSEAKGKSGQHV